MRRLRHPLLSLNAVLVLASCASAPKSATEDVHAAAQAAKTRYWAIQAAQKPAASPTGYEILPIQRPERTEEGIIFKPATDYLRVRRLP